MAIYKSAYFGGKLAQRIMDNAHTLTFQTGKPVAPIRAGYKGRKCMFLTFETSGGQEDFFDSSLGSMAGAIEGSEYIITFKPRKS